MNLIQYKALFILVTAVLALFVASPALQHILVYPRTEFFTEFSLLGPGHMAQDYPYNISNNANYHIFLVVTNQLGSCAFYQVQVKFRNETQSAPDIFNRTFSSLPSLYNLNFFVADRESLELPVNFAFGYSFLNISRTVYTNVTVPQGPGKNDTIVQRVEKTNLLTAKFESLMINGETLNFHDYTSDWNPQNVFYGNLVFELWIYNNTAGVFQYNERFVDLKFNMTRQS